MTTSPVLVVLLGASNLARAHWALVTYLRTAFHGRDVEFLTVMGPGRAYCVKGGILNVTYPAIAETRFLAAVREKARAGWRVIALITDIGNDIMYGVPAQRIVHCLDNIIAGLQREGHTHVVTTAIHVEPMEDMSRSSFGLLRAVFFAGSRVRYEEAASAVSEINRFLVERSDRNLLVIGDMKTYAGWDKIHFSLLRSHRAWTRVAEHMLRCVSKEPTGVIGPLDMARSVLVHIAHLLFCEVVPLREKTGGTFLDL